MPILLQIDSCLGILSTGRITESIGAIAQFRGWDCYLAHGTRYVGESQMMSIPVVTKFGEYLHFVQSILFDNHGLASVSETKKFINKIKVIKPDVIQLHCIHGYYINYKILFEYLNATNIPVVWTFHDCWAFTGHCAHFDTTNCNKWKEEGCHDCPLISNYPKAYIDNSRNNFKLKKELFSSNKKLHIVAVSNWLASYTKESFLKDKNIRVINNGIDINLFRPCAEKSEKFSIIGVASAWNKDKGLYDFFKLRKVFPVDEVEISLVGLTKEQLNELPEGINGVTKTSSVQELARLYSNAHVFVNPTYADSFPTVNMEALACGTPVITYNTGGSPEIVDFKSGVVVEKGDVNALADVIKKIKECPLMSKDCRERAERLYNKDERFMDYIKLYEEFIADK